MKTNEEVAVTVNTYFEELSKDQEWVKIHYWFTLYLMKILSLSNKIQIVLDFTVYLEYDMNLLRSEKHSCSNMSVSRTHLLNIFREVNKVMFQHNDTNRIFKLNKITYIYRKWYVLFIKSLVFLCLLQTKLVVIMFVFIESFFFCRERRDFNKPQNENWRQDGIKDFRWVILFVYQ